MTIRTIGAACQKASFFFELQNDPNRRARAPPLRIDKLLLTPSRARTILAGSDPLRPVRKDTVTAFSRAMAGTEWVLNGIPIVVSNTGRLLDGRHRLLACVEADTGFPTLIAWDVPDDVIVLIDQHLRRSFAHVLEARGVAQPHAVEQLLNQLLHYHDGTLGRRSPAQPWARLERVLRHNPDMLSLTPVAGLPDGLQWALPFMGGRADPAALARLLDGYANPALAPEAAAGAMLRHALAQPRQDRSAGARASRELAFAILALNAEQEGRAPRRLAWSPGRDFPVLTGYPPLAGADWAPEPTLHPPADVALTRCEISVRMVTPALAAEYLRHNDGNRRPVAAHVEALARDMRAGRWALSPQPICFAASGRLLNGQHRLLAILRADVAVELPVVVGLPEAALDTYDRQARAGPVVADLTPGFGDGALVAAMANLLWRHECAPPGSRRLKASAAELRGILAAHPRLLEMRSLARRMVDYGRPSVLGYAAYVITREDPVLGAAFLRRLDGSVAEPPTQPVARLRRQLLAMRRGGAAREAALQAVLETWRQMRARPELLLRAGRAATR